LQKLIFQYIITMELDNIKKLLSDPNSYMIDQNMSNTAFLCLQTSETGILTELLNHKNYNFNGTPWAKLLIKMLITANKTTPLFEILKNKNISKRYCDFSIRHTKNEKLIKEIEKIKKDK
jgi:hypothetical protein